VLKLVYPIFKRAVLPWLKLFLKDTKGIENIPKKGPFIVASNHDSVLDPLLLLYSIVKRTNQKIHFITHQGRFGFFGKYIIKKWAGCILIRYNKKDISAAMEEAVSVLKNRGIVGIFPAGGYGDLLKSKTGVARIALAAQCPVLPVIIKGMDEVMPLPSIIPRRFRFASVQFKKPMIFKKTQKNVNLVTKKIVEVISRGLNQK